jgi:fumarate hydratase subunit alpha
MICHPKGLGSGQVAELKIFSFPSKQTIREYVLGCIARAGSRHCPPVIIGVGIGGTIDVAAKLAKKAMLRPLHQAHSNPEVALMEKQLLKAANSTGIGPMGTGGDTTAWAVHIELCAGHGFIPIAVCYDCWMGRVQKARLFNDGQVEYFEE